MEKFEVREDGPLRIERTDGGDKVVLEFKGKSILRDPAEFLQPILFQMLDEIEQSGSRLVLDFRELTYMNSSTFTPLIKTLEKGRLGDFKITVLFSSDKRWQSVSFAALTIFETRDGRVSIESSE